jgi:molybdopterin-guanine dinucleotide biosynthesis protein A
MISDPAGIVLCGGKSSRMGRPKAWLPFGPNEVMLQRVVRLVGEAVSFIVVVAAPDQELPPLPDSVVIVRDEVAERGPLQGLSAGLSAVPQGIEFAYATSTDVPFLNPEWIRFLRQQIGTADIAMPFVGGYHQPLSALYRTSAVQPAIATLLASNRLRPLFLIESVKTVFLEEEVLRSVDPGLQTLRNLNTMEDYQLALTEWSNPEYDVDR